MEWCRERQTGGNLTILTQRSDRYCSSSTLKTSNMRFGKGCCSQIEEHGWGSGHLPELSRATGLKCFYVNKQIGILELVESDVFWILCDRLFFLSGFRHEKIELHGLSGRPRFCIASRKCCYKYKCYYIPTPLTTWVPTFWILFFWFSCKLVKLVN